MTTISPEELDLLVKVCGMLGSGFEAERAAAALKATELLHRAGLRWEDVLQQSPETRSERRPLHERTTAPRHPQSQATFVDWRADLACCKNNRNQLSAAEADYVDGLCKLLLHGRVSVRHADMTKLANLARRIRSEASRLRRRRQAAGQFHAAL